MLVARCVLDDPTVASLLTRLPDMGSNPGWHNLLGTLTSLVFRHSVVRRPEEVPVYLLVCIPCASLGPTVEADWASWTHELE